MIKVFTTKNYFTGLLLLILGIALIMLFLFLGLLVLPVILIILVVFYLILSRLLAVQAIPGIGIT